MKQFLLDTCTFIWITTHSPKLSNRLKNIYLNKDHQIFLSVISIWEIIIKHQLARITFQSPPETLITSQCQKEGIDIISLDEKDVFHLVVLPKLHNDPFDRMLICQAKARKLIILTPDNLIRSYPVKTIW